MLRDEIVPYISGDGLVSNRLVLPGTFRACDNGILFTSIYYILLKESGQLNSTDIMDYKILIKSCASSPGDDYLHRAPGDSSLDEQDDHNGAYAAHIVLGIKPPFALSSNLWRFPSLIAMDAIASQNIFYRIIAAPMVALTAIIIATSCIGAPESDTDSRIGAWLVGKATKSSFMCRCAFWIWKRRLLKDYTNGMRDVMAMYFGPEHPLAKYFVVF